SHLVQSSSILLLHDRTPATQIYTLSLHDALPIYATPRVGETVSASDWSNASGSEPYFRISARLEALSWLKFPEIVVVPPGIASCTVGAETTSVSSTKATRSPTFFEVKSPQIRAPSLLNFRLTVQPGCPCCGLGGTACASSISLPSKKTGSSRYFSVPSWLQVTSGSFG